MSIESFYLAKENSSEAYHQEQILFREKLDLLFQQPEQYQKLLDTFSFFSRFDVVQEQYANKTVEDIADQLEVLKEVDDKELFVEQASSLLDPLIRFKVDHPVRFEDIEALKMAEDSDFTPLNQRLSFGEGVNEEGQRFFHIHFSQAHALKSQCESQAEWVNLMEELYIDGLRQLAVKAKKDENVAYILSTSWLNATKTYGAQKRRLGFVDFEPVSEEFRAKWFASDDRDISRCVLPRDELLKRYGSIAE